MRATRHYVQGYRVLKGRDRKTGRLEPADRLEVLGAAVACRRAERMYATGRYAGVADRDAEW